MAGQAGWYRAPGEDGVLRYWNGTAWTDHRQPATSAPPVAEAKSSAAHDVLAEDPDPMAEYERQFATPSPSAFDLPSYGLNDRSVEEETAAPTPEFAGQSLSVPRSFAPRPAPARSTPLASSPSEDESEFEQVFGESRSIEDAGAPAEVTDAPALSSEGTVSTAPADVVIAPNRKRVLAAFRGMGIAILVVLIGVAAMAFFGAQGQAGAGEAKTIGIVTSLGVTTGNSCTPIARFAVKGRSLTANSNAAITPCPVGLGQDVDVIYSAVNPASAARIQLGTSWAQYLWSVPLLGALFFLACLIVFVVRAGSLLAGIALVRDGHRRPNKPVRA